MKIITFDGLPAAGKSTYSRAIIKKFNWTYGSIDTAEKQTPSYIWQELLTKIAPKLEDGMPKFLWKIGLWHLVEQDKQVICCEEFWSALYEITRRLHLSGPKDEWKKLFDIAYNAYEYMNVLPDVSFYLNISVEESELRALIRQEEKCGEVREEDEVNFKRTESNEELLKYWEWLQSQYDKLYIIDGTKKKKEILAEMETIINDAI